MITAAPSKYFPALDGLRALAVVMVILFHAGATSNLPGLAPGGFLGVTVFFTISGFLVMSLLLRDVDTRGGVDVAGFWTRRIKRLWPASLLVVVLAVVLARWFWQNMQASDAAAGVFGYTNWHVILSGQSELLRTTVGPLGPFWSLAIEEQFYVALTLAFVLAIRSRRPIRVLTIIVVIGLIVSVGAAIVVNGPQYWLEFSTVTRIGEILVGCGLALLLHQHPNIVERSQRGLGVAGPLAMLAILAVAATTDYDPPWLLHGGYVVIATLSAIVVMALTTPGWLTSSFARKPIVTVGVASYSLYLVHWPVMLMLSPARIGLDRWSLVGVKLIAAAIAGAALHRFVEQPLRRRSVRQNTVWLVWATGCTAVVLLAIVVL